MRDKKIIELPPHTSLLDLELAGLHYQARGDLKFEYSSKEEFLPFWQLTWGNIWRSIQNKFSEKSDVIIIDGSSRNFGANITPGKYIVKATALLPNFLPSQQPDIWTIIAEPHWYQTIWFSLALAALGIFLVWRYVKATLAVRQLESTASELQLQAIKAQINPHFVGNSINAIQQFFYPPDPLKASQYISIFSDLLRRTISLSEKKFIPIRDELSYILDYLEMIRLRFGDRFVYSLTGTENISSILPFPSMILQPLIENATIHGFSELGTSKLQIDFDQHGGLLICTITDNGIGIYTSQERKKALGIKRDSKGLALLDKKIQTLNRLYNIEMKIEYKELSVQINGTSGTQAKLSFLPGKVDKSLLELQ